MDINSAKLLLKTAMAAATAGKKACQGLLLLLPDGKNKNTVVVVHSTFQSALELLSEVKL